MHLSTALRKNLLNFLKMNNKPKIYISGKITGIEDTAPALFEAAENKLSKYFTVVNPLKLNHDHNKTWESYMRVDLAELLKCEFIYLLPNWKDSKGARIEMQLAADLQMPVVLLKSDGFSILTNDAIIPPPSIEIDLG